MGRVAALLLTLAVLTASVALSFYLVGRGVFEKVTKPEIEHFSFHGRSPVVGFTIRSDENRTYAYVISYNSSERLITMEEEVTVVKGSPYTCIIHWSPRLVR